MGGGRIGLIFGPLACMLVYKLGAHKPDSAWPNPVPSRSRPQRAGGGPCALLDRRLPAAEQIYGHLREEIITCRLAPNEAISENRICGMFGVSRSPVRIALTRLAEDGLIDIFPQRGSFVAPIRMKQVQREPVRAHGPRDGAGRGGGARNGRRAMPRRPMPISRTRSATRKTGDAWGFYLDNERFHQLIARAAGLEGVWKTVQAVKMLWDRVGHLANRVQGHRRGHHRGA